MLLSSIFRVSLGVATIASVAAPVFAAPGDTQIVGNVRVQALSPSLVRLEIKGANGFEDRPTFHVVERKWGGATLTRNEANGIVTLKTTHWSVRVPADASSLEGITITDASGKTIYTAPPKLSNAAWLPNPSEKTVAWAVADTPRLIPPAWGATPPPPGNTLHPETSGWDTSNNAPDLYVFLPTGGEYRELRRDYLRLTGPTELPPLYLFGMFHSRYYPYTQKEAREVIATYRRKKLPLDVMVLDTDWRVGASVGYAPNTKLFDDLPGYLKAVHGEGIRTMFNDHPEPKVREALNPTELNFRFDGLSQWLNQNMDIWWYDRNWGISLNSPMPGLRHEVWGMRVYHDMTQRTVPNRRPATMTNVDGIDNGIRNRPANMAAHRFSIQWTGDTSARWEFLRRGVENAVYSGVHSLIPYMSEDLGGHNAGPPTPELYVRFLEYGAFSPTMRPHCTAGESRAPWDFGPEAERIVTDYARMRYRMLPYFYAAARRNYDTGEPLLRRLDLEYPDFAEAAANDQYLIGQHLLVAPIMDTAPAAAIPPSWFTTTDGKPGVTAEYFPNVDLSGAPTTTRTEPAIDVDWGRNAPLLGLPATNFSARWVGKITNPTKEAVVFYATADDRIRVFLDGKAVIDEWHPSEGNKPYRAEVALEPGKTYDLRVEFVQEGGGSLIHLGYQAAKIPAPQRSLWVPPGTWTNLWTGETVRGPKKITVAAPLAQIPLFARPGAIVPLVPQMQYTGERPWDQVALEIFPVAGARSFTDLYEDDTTSNDYAKDGFRSTRIAASTDTQGDRVQVMIGAAKGKAFPGAVAKRRWTLRLRKPASITGKPTQVLINGKPVKGWRVFPRATGKAILPFQITGAALDGDVLQIDLPAVSVNQSQTVTVQYFVKK